RALLEQGGVRRAVRADRRRLRREPVERFEWGLDPAAGLRRPADEALQIAEEPFGIRAAAGDLVQRIVDDRADHRLRAVRFRQRAAAREPDTGADDGDAQV